jgi:aspartate carbamoyltransferase catalytic subunit
VIGQQVEAGVVVRMAVLYELLAGKSAPQPALSTPVPA